MPAEGCTIFSGNGFLKKSDKTVQTFHHSTSQKFLTLRTITSTFMGQILLQDLLKERLHVMKVVMKVRGKKMTLSFQRLQRGTVSTLGQAWHIWWMLSTRVPKLSGLIKFSSMRSMHPQSAHERNIVQATTQQRTWVSWAFEKIVISHFFLENAYARRKEQAKKTRGLIFRGKEQDPKTSRQMMSGETNDSDNVKNGIQQIKQLRQEHRERNKSC